MLTVHLLRHGQTAWNVERRFLGRTDVALDDIGLTQVAALPGVFPAVVRVWSSPLQRAVVTARILGEPTLDAGLVEMDMGVLEGLDTPAALKHHSALLQRFQSDPSLVIIPEGETMTQAGGRMLRAWTRIVATAGPDDTVAIVSHQMALAALLCRLTGSPLSAYRNFTQRNTAWTSVVVDQPSSPTSVTVLGKDTAPHLD